ncbi:MAG: hypothetical protein WC249_02690 [Patescibacteria group bacterium]
MFKISGKRNAQIAIGVVGLITVDVRTARIGITDVHQLASGIPALILSTFFRVNDASEKYKIFQQRICLIIRR